MSIDVHCTLYSNGRNLLELWRDCFKACNGLHVAFDYLFICFVFFWQFCDRLFVIVLKIASSLRVAVLRFFVSVLFQTLQRPPCGLYLPLFALPAQRDVPNWTHYRDKRRKWRWNVSRSLEREKHLRRKWKYLETHSGGEITQICGRNGNILLAGFNDREQLRAGG